MGPLTRQNVDDERLMTLVERALERPVAHRRTFLEQACSEDTLLLETAWRYVQQEQGLGEFLKEPLLAPPEPRDTLHYEIESVLGEGGQAKVYKAWDKNLKRHVALKFLPPHLRAGSVERQRFLREATAVSALDHPNLGTVHAIEETSSGLFIVMPYYEGGNLRQRIKDGALAPSKAIEIAKQVAQGLSAAHAEGVVHRDLKPSNLIVAKSGAVKIIDFGIARVEGDQRLTETGLRIGTVSYMSPEQAMGEKADQRTDLWSLGAVLFEMLTGHAPFRGENAQKVILAILSAPLPPMPGISPAVQRIVRKLLNREPEDRYQTAAEVLAALEAVEGQTEERTRTLVPSELRRWKPSRTQRLSAALAIAVVILAGLLAWHYARGAPVPADYLAVLPFETAESDPAEQALARGLSQALAEALRRYEADNRTLLVLPPAELQAQQGTDVASARKAFSVHEVLTGTLTRENGQIRLVLNLLDAARQRATGSSIVQEPDSNLPAVYRRAVAESVRMLALRGAPSGTGPGARSEAWLRGIGFLERYDNPGNLDAAINEFQGALKSGPNALALAGLSEAYRLRYDTLKAPESLAASERYASEAIALNGELPEAWISRGSARNFQSDYKGAIEDFERALLFDARADRAYRGLARAYDGLGLKDRAEETYRRAIEARPGYWAGYNQLGAFYLRIGRHRDAVAAFRETLRRAPDSASVYSNLAAALRQSGQLDEARTALEKSVAIAPTLAGYINLGNVLSLQKSYAQAAQAYEKALELNKSSYKIWANLASCYLHISGQKDRGMDAYRKAAELAETAQKASPNDAVVLSDLATYYVKLGKRSDPLELVMKALALAPRNPRVLVNVAEVYESLGFRDQALENLGRAFQLGFPPKDIEDVPTFDGIRTDNRFKALIPARQ